MINNVINHINHIVGHIKKEILGRWTRYDHHRYLQRMGWTEETYQKHKDPAVRYGADRISHFYYGYEHYHVFLSPLSAPFDRYDSWEDALKAMEVWCKDNCAGKWRHDWHRVFQSSHLPEDYFINEIGGGDSIVFAFKDGRDFMLFGLRWL